MVYCEKTKNIKRPANFFKCAPLCWSYLAAPRFALRDGLRRKEVLPRQSKRPD